LKVGEIRAFTDEELKKQLEQAHQELFNARFKVSTQQLTNNREVARLKKRIARLKTVIRERELGIMRQA
jgi:large subunit ribosomal protein L29